MQDRIEIETTTPVSASVIWLHGLGADGNDFVPIVPALSLPAVGVRFIFPHAPERPVTINGGMPMRAWYDILAMGAQRQVNEEQLLQSAARIDALVAAEELRGVPRARIFLVGFSQGGAVAYHCGLRSDPPVGGVALLSTYRINPARFPARAVNRQLPLFCAHGDYDDVVPATLGRQGYQSLIDEGLAPEWHAYPMAHEVCLAQIQALGVWLARLLAD